MKYDELRDLITHIDQSSLAYVDYETDTHHVVISKEVPNRHVPQEVVDQKPAVVETTVEKEVIATEVVEEVLEPKGEAVEAPMVGVVYLQATPDADPYVKVGDRVNQGDVIFIVEAMKLMNEIQAPISGVITEILVENEEVVEYGQAIMRIEG